MVSCIIPVYNTEKYLPRCIESVLAQTFVDWEMLLIDDGSTDASGSICDEYAAKDERIRVFHKENGGISSARNVGLNYAQGEWIFFVDSDDSLPKTSLESLLSRSSDANIIAGGFFFVFGGDKIVETLKEPKFTSRDLDRKIPTAYMATVWGKLFKRKICPMFDERVRFAEDTLFILSCVRETDRIKLVDDTVYTYNNDAFPDKYSMTADEYSSYLDIFGGVLNDCERIYGYTFSETRQYLKKFFTARLLYGIFHINDFGLFKEEIKKIKKEDIVFDSSKKKLFFAALQGGFLSFVLMRLLYRIKKRINGDFYYRPGL